MVHSVFVCPSKGGRVGASCSYRIWERRPRGRVCQPTTMEDERKLEESMADVSVDEAKEAKKKAKAEAKAAKAAKAAAKAAAAAEKGKKKTKLGLSVTKEENFGDWYSEIVTEAELISYYDVSGCYILRPWAYAIWEELKAFFDGEIKKLGVENCYFPMFVPESNLIKEKDHVEGFAPEVAWVTKSGDTDLDVPIAVRPTSETVMYPYYADWIRSHRDLPLKLNQWCNVVRWEFKHPTPFIRSREFLWQEGHTAYATKAEADEEVKQILDLYRRIFEDLLCVPVIPGVKSEKEKFAGGLYTTTVEAYVPANGRAIQGATSHCLGQNFAKMFGIEFETEERARALVWQNSWGFTTRTIGVMVMVHGDDKGLVLPPKVAPLQVVVIPLPFKGCNSSVLVGAAEELTAELKAAGLRVRCDARENYTPGWKYNHWELKGVPLRIELGPKDLEQRSARFVRRDNGAKEDVSWQKLVEQARYTLEQVQKDLLDRATKERDQNVVEVRNWEDFLPALDAKKLVLAPWCEETAVEEWVKANSAGGDGAMGAKTLCIPFKQPALPEGTMCFAAPDKPAKRWTLWGRSY